MTRALTIAMRRPHSDKQKRAIVFPRNVMLIAGRRFGKTDALTQRIYYWMVRQPGLYWWIGLSWKSASMKRAWRIIQWHARRILMSLGLDPREYINKTNKEIAIPGLGEIWFRTAENPASLAGEALRGVVLDEVTLMREEVWTEYVSAALLDYGGWAAMAGVPKGRNWVWEHWNRVADADDWLRIHATTYDNPFISQERVDALRGVLSDLVFRQEILAEFVEAEGIVFRGVDKVAVAQPLLRGEGGRLYVYGLDWGKHQDYTVFSVLDPTDMRQVYLERISRLDYGYQLRRLREVAQRFPPQVMIAEGNSVGERLVEEMQEMGLPVVRFMTTNASKREIIEALQLAIENETITLLDDSVQTAELKAFEVRVTPSGTAIYGAPSGLHDDTVIALALALYGARQGQVMVALI